MLNVIHITSLWPFKVNKEIIQKIRFYLVHSILIYINIYVTINVILKYLLDNIKSFSINVVPRACLD